MVPGEHGAALCMKQDEALGERLKTLDQRNRWMRDAPCALFWTIQSLRTCGRKRRVMCPEECVVTLGMTSKCVWVLLARLHRRFRAVVTVLPFVSMESMAGGLSGMRE